MFTTVLDLSQLSDFVADMEIVVTDDPGPMLIHQGSHPDFARCTIAQAQGCGLLVSTKPYRERPQLAAEG